MSRAALFVRTLRGGNDEDALTREGGEVELELTTFVHPLAQLASSSASALASLSRTTGPPCHQNQKRWTPCQSKCRVLSAKPLRPSCSCPVGGEPESVSSTCLADLGLLFCHF